MDAIRPTKSNIINLEKGKLPPQAIDIEEAVLGAILIDVKAAPEVMDLLSADVFYKEAHRYIYEAIFQVFNSNGHHPIDLLTVSQQLRKNEKLELAGGDYYLIQLTQKIASSAHIEYHARILIQKHIQRKCISVSSEVIENSYNENFDVFELLEKVYKNFDNINELINVGKETDFKEEVLSFLSEKNIDTDGVKGCISKFNSITNGYQNTDLIIFAARPGMGKTAFILNDILSMAMNGEPVAFFSLEMSVNQIIGRFLSIMSGINGYRLKKRSDLSSEELILLRECSLILSNLPIYIDDTSGLSPLELKLKVLKLKREKKIKICYVDYLQLMKVKDRKVNREQEVSIISSSLKGLAKELNIPVIALSQLSRDVEKRGSNKRPLLSDLRDSGSIEQDADIVIFLYRPEYYKIDNWDDNESASTLNTAEIDIAKFRNGETGYIRVGCDLKYMRFYDVFLNKEQLDYKYLNQNKDTPIQPEIINKSFDFNENNDVPF